jgi:hypothetical protein
VSYQPKWGSLTTALKRATTDTDLCNAIADGVVRVRAFVRQYDGDPDIDESWLVCFTDVEVPPRLSPEDFDWAASRPLAPWRVMGPEFERPRYLPIEELELALENLDSVFGRARPSKQAVHDRSVDTLVESLMQNPNLTREEVARKLGMSRSDQRLTSIMSEARRRCGLPAKGSPGRPPKTSPKLSPKLS